MLGKSPAPSSDTVGLTLDTGKPLGPGGVGADFGGLSEVPASVGNVDITSLAPFLPLLGKIPPELTAQIALLVPKVRAGPHNAPQSEATRAANPAARGRARCRGARQRAVCGGRGSI